MFLLLDYTICNSFITVKFFTTDLSNMRTHTILSTHMINENNDNPFYNNIIIIIIKYIL